MAITVQANPVSLTWADYTVVPNQIMDPADQTLVDAYTSFRFDLPDRPPAKWTVNLHWLTRW